METNHWKIYWTMDGGMWEAVREKTTSKDASFSVCTHPVAGVNPLQLLPAAASNLPSQSSAEIQAFPISCPLIPSFVLTSDIFGTGTDSRL